MVAFILKLFVHFFGLFFFKLDYLTEPTTDKAVSGLFRNLIRRIADTSLLKEMSWSGVAREGSADVQYKYSLKSQPNVVTLICGTGMCLLMH